MSSNDSGGLTQEKLGLPSDPCAMVIFGAGGDLTKRKLLPSLYHLAKGKLLPQQFAIVGLSIEPFSHDEFRDRMTQDIQEYAGVKLDASWDDFAKRFYYLSGDFNDPELYRKLGEMLKQVEKEQGTEGTAFFTWPRLRIFLPSFPSSSAPPA